MRTDLSEAQEDYLESIYEIIQEKGGIRAKDIANRLQVKNSSVTVALRGLRGEGLINYEPYGVISLTESGEEEARRLSETHHVFHRFFVNILGVDQNAANDTACRLEHMMSPSVMARFLEFMKFMTLAEDRGSDWKKLFEQFCIDNKVSAGNLASPAEYMSQTAVPAGEK